MIVAQATNNPTMPNRIIAVIGPGECDAATADLARDMGALIARAGHALITGGLGGVMLAASDGASAAGGLVVGLLPGEDTADANEHVAVPIATGVGQGRNVMLVNSADAIIAIGKSYGTPKAQIRAELKAGHDVLFDIDWQGTQQLYQKAQADVVRVFILPPSLEELSRRLIGRGTDSAEVIA
ncbi:MAG: TIGR00725 family protein, partial [Planctomycetes bacterium]|nr:TIGR00725 family protein [Planctomycetota bacterium]